MNSVTISDGFKVYRLHGFNTHCVQALEKVFWGQLAPAVLHIHAPIKLSILTTYKENLVRKAAQKIVDR